MVTMVLMWEALSVFMGCAGWIGAVGTLVAYGLVSQRRLDANSLRCQAINALSAGLLALSALSADSWPSFAANVAWMSIGLGSLFRSRAALRVAIDRRLRAEQDATPRVLPASRRPAAPAAASDRAA